MTVDADQVTYDESTFLIEAVGNVRLSYRGLHLTADFVQFYLRSEVFTAQGHVVLVDAEGRELRGELLTYDVRAMHAEVAAAALRVNGLYVQSARVQQRRDLIVADDTTLTTCNPDRPVYRLTASRVEVYPGDRVVAHNASFWIGGFRLFSLPSTVVQLDTSEDTARSFPRGGYDVARGTWFEYWYFFRLGGLRGRAAPLLGTRTYGAELAFTLWSGRLGWLPLSGTLLAASGWYKQNDPMIDAMRSYYEAALTTGPITLGPATTWETTGSYRDTYYGTGERQGVLRVDSAVTYHFNELSFLRLSYDRVEVAGLTPLALDTIELEDQINTIGLQFTQITPRGLEIDTAFTAGVSYTFRDLTNPANDMTTSVNAGYTDRHLDRYHWGLGGAYNLGTGVLRLATDAGAAIGGNTYLTVQTVYDTSLGSFEDLDYIVRTSICDCIDVGIKYRQMRQEIWVEIGLTAFRAPGPPVPPLP